MNEDRLCHIRERTSEILLDINAFEFRFDRPFVFSSGVRSPVYCDCRLLMGYPELWEEVVDFMVEVLNSEAGLDRLAAVATSGIPHCALLSQKLRKPMVYVRSEKKAYGKQKRVEGILRRGETLAVVEDVISTGRSSLETIKILRNLGTKVGICVGIFTYGFKETMKAFDRAKCKLLNLSNIETILDTSLRKKIITDEQKNLVLEWKENPEKWWEDYGIETKE